MLLDTNVMIHARVNSKRNCLQHVPFDSVAAIDAARIRVGPE
jgi:hypothetical protein